MAILRTNMRNYFKLSLFILPIFCGHVFAYSDSDVFKKIENHIVEQTKLLPGKITYDVKRMDLSKLRFDKCQKLEAYTPHGGKIVGQITVGVRCLDVNAEKPSNVIIQAEVAQESTYVVATTKITSGEELSKENTREEVGNIALFYFNIYSKMDDVIGKKTKSLITEGDVDRYFYGRYNSSFW